MSNYCTYTNVGVLLGVTFTASTTPNITQVEEVIGMITAEIDMHLKNAGISTQPTDANALALLKLNCARGSACVVGKSFYGGPQNVEGTLPNSFCTEYKEFLTAIDEHPEIFGASTGNETINFGNNVTAGYDTESGIMDKRLSPESWEY